MREPILDVRFYATERGREPVREFLLDLTMEDRRAVGTDLKTVQFGWPLGMPLVRKMGDGLWEVRSTIPDGIVRVLFTVREQQMVLLHAFVKKSPKTPAPDMDTAQRRLRRIKGD